MRKYASWDVETHKVLPEELPDGKNIMDYRPLGISCIALRCTENEETQLFYSGMRDGKTLPRKMNVYELSIFVNKLWEVFVSGYIPLAWNGNFDFQILLEELENTHVEQVKKMARASVDPMYNLFCVKGYPLALETAAKGMGVAGKLEGMSGALAPAMWQESEESRQVVLDYVAQDVIVPLNVVEAIEDVGGLRWTSKSNKPQFCRMKPIMTVEEAYRLPPADNSWMTNPIPKSNFYTWAFDQPQEPIESLIAEKTGIGIEIVRSVLKAHEQFS